MPDPNVWAGHERRALTQCMCVVCVRIGTIVIVAHELVGANIGDWQ